MGIGKDKNVPAWRFALIQLINKVADRLGGGLTPAIYDHTDITYVAAGNGAGEIETVTYRVGGSGGDIVALVTMTYDGSDKLITATRT